MTKTQTKPAGLFMPRALYGVIGWPLGQSLSPLLHNTGFQTLGIPAIYMAWPIEEKDLDIFIKSMRALKIKGASVTIPHKVAVKAHVAGLTDAASLAGAVNTLFWREDALWGDNTDVSGFMAPLREWLKPDMAVLLLGAGGAARAICAGLKMAARQNVVITSPGGKRQGDLAPQFGFEAAPWQDRHKLRADLVINATPMGMRGELEAETPYDFKVASHTPALAYDIVYNPLVTRFLKEAEKAGAKTISGLEMFYGQGDAQFRLWTGEALPRQARIALENALKARE